MGAERKVKTRRDLLQHRQAKAHRRARPGVLLEPDAPTVRLDQCFTDGQPQARTTGAALRAVSAPESLEQLIAVFGRDARPFISDAHLDGRSHLPHCNGHQRLWRGIFRRVPTPGW